MGAPEPLPKLVQDSLDQQLRLMEGLQKKLDAQTAKQDAARQAAQRAAAKAEADFRAGLAPWNPNVFRMDGRVDTDAAVKRVNEALANDPALAATRMKELQARTDEVRNLTMALDSLALHGDVETDLKERLERATERRDALMSDTRFVTRLTANERDAFQESLAHPTQWSETGSFQAGRFTVEVSVNAPPSTGNIADMKTSTGTDRTSSSSHDTQIADSQSRGRSVELGVGGEGSALPGGASAKVGASEGSSSTVTTGRGHSESTAVHQGAETTNPGERHQVEMFAVIKDGHGTDVRVSLGQVLVAQQK